jgi:hypothetical protein
MRLYDVECPCGNIEALAKSVDDGMVVCDECGELTKVIVKGFPTPAIVGVWTDRPITIGNDSRQSFTSAKELDAYCEARGVTYEAPGSRARKELAHASREAAEASARRDGFRDLDHYMNATQSEKRDRLAATREKESAKRVGMFGSSAKVAADDSSWNGAMPESDRIVSKPRTD